MAIVDLLRPQLPATFTAANRLTAAMGSAPGTLTRLLPGTLLCGAVTLVAVVLERLEASLFGHAWLEAMVLAILVGTVVRTVWTPGPRWCAGIGFSAKTLLEVAVVLFGASVSLGAVMTAGPALLLGIVAVVIVAIGASYGLGRGLGLPHRMAVLVACGNSICGNSAIAAVAPVIGADGEEVAASIAFTAMLGVLVVLGLPFLPALLNMTGVQYGVLAGLTVYAVPQVLAATAPLGAIAVQLGTLVKLMRVLMLGPVILVLTLVTRRRDDGAASRVDRSAAKRMPWHKLVPWFIDGFLLLAVLRSFGLIPQAALAPTAAAAAWLTVLSMAALGLSTDLRSVAKAGPRVTAAVTLSLLVLGAISLGLIHVLGIV